MKRVRVALLDVDGLWHMESMVAPTFVSCALIAKTKVRLIGSQKKPEDVPAELRCQRNGCVQGWPGDERPNT